MTTVQEYIDAKPLPFPLIHPDGKVLRIDTLQVYCGKCWKTTEDVHGSVVFHASCTEVEAGGVCHACQTVTWSRTRFYENHFLAWKDGEIRRGDYPVSWVGRIKKIMKRFSW